MTPWNVKATEFVNCNCAYGCPCQFNALPTYGFCEAIGAYDIVEGQHGDVRLDGLKVITIFHWPGPIHLGKGHRFIIIDERASGPQREALERLLTGDDTEPGKTVWNVFASTVEQSFDTVFKKVDLSIDVDARRAHLSIDGLVESSAEPIRNPVTGAEHRARIDLPDGFEYTIAEMGSGSSDISGPIPLKFEATYAQLAHIHLSQSGIVR
jgi:hypothetical protein